MTDLQALAYAMRMEQESEKYYNHYSSRCKSDNSKIIFEALAKMEVEHYKILEKQYSSILKGENWLEIKLDNFKSPEVFLNKGSDRITESELDSELSDVTILRLAYLMENDLAIFYKEWAERTEDSFGKKLLKKLSFWENEHYNMLYAEHTTLLKNSWFKMGFAPF